MGKKKPKRKRHWRIAKWIFVGIVIALIGAPILFERTPELPPGTHTTVRVPVHDPSRVLLLTDTTAFDSDRKKRVINQEIFDHILKMIEDARSVIYADFFLWNSWQGELPERHRQVAGELADALLAKRRNQPEVTILVLTDPINRIYGDHEEAFYARLRDNGIAVVFTDLNRLHDSNVLYSRHARFYARVLDRLPGGSKWLDATAVKNPLSPSEDPITRRQAARLLHFKANHRKLLVTDTDDGDWRMLVTSFNPANGSSAHSNVALVLDGEPAAAALRAELDVVEWSAARPGYVLQREDTIAETVAELRDRLDARTTPEPPSPAAPAATWLTEGAIREHIIRMLDNAGPGDVVRIGLFYLADRVVVRSIADAAYAGADVRLILDANKDAFGREKNGNPNRPVAAELLRLARDQGLPLEIRWADTHGEQFHSKVMSVSGREGGRVELIAGSANWTRRNIQDLNLEACMRLSNCLEVTEAFNAYFDALWGNSDGLGHTVSYEAFEQTGIRGRFMHALYMFQEATGACTW